MAIRQAVCRDIRESTMKYFIDTHDKTKGSFPAQELTREEFVEIYGKFDDACAAAGGFAQGAHVNLGEGKAYCFTAAQDVDAIAKAHADIDFPYDSITAIERVTGLDMR
jgi:hypothetical protein